MCARVPRPFLAAALAISVVMLVIVGCVARQLGREVSAVRALAPYRARFDACLVPPGTQQPRDPDGPANAEAACACAALPEGWACGSQHGYLGFLAPSDDAATSPDWFVIYSPRGRPALAMHEGMTFVDSGWLFTTSRSHLYGPWYIQGFCPMCD